MKRFYLLLLNKYKKEIVLLLSVFTLIGISIQYHANVLSISSILVISMSYLYCLYAWMNGTFTFAGPVDDNSNNSDVFWRWIMIFIGFFLFFYAILAPIYQ